MDDNSVVFSFSEENAAKLTGISQRQLRYWDKTGFFTPAYADENRNLVYSRIYSFKDIVALRVLNVLRNQYGVSLPHLRQVSAKLTELSDSRWTSTTLYVLKKRVHFDHPRTGRRQDVLNGQYALGIPLKVITADTKRDVAAFLKRPEDKIGSVVRRRSVAHNNWVLGGTRIPTAFIKNFADAGYSVQQIISEYPSLTEEDVAAALASEQAHAA